MRRGFKQILCLVICILVTGSVVACKGNKPKESNVETNSATDSEESNTETSTTTENEENTTPTVAVELPSLTYIGHASVKIKSSDGKVIYIDPYYSNGDYTDKADFVLVTHGHEDHQPWSGLKKNEGCTNITYLDALKDGEYQTYDYGNVKIEAVAAGGNSNHDIKNCVGYIVTVDGIKIYHAGDTSMIDQMESLKDMEIDYAMYPIDGKYNMDAIEATKVANLVAAKNNIPIHEFDVAGSKKSDNFTPEGRLVLEYGETILIKE